MLGFWFWAFSFAYSDSFFEYNLCSRLPVFVDAWFGAAAIQSSTYLAWKRHQTLVSVYAFHATGLGVAVGPLVVVSFLLSRLSGPCHLEADDAMGAGIDFMILIGIGAVSLLVLLFALLIRGVRRSSGVTTGGNN